LRILDNTDGSTRVIGWEDVAISGKTATITVSLAANASYTLLTSPNSFVSAADRNINWAMGHVLHSTVSLPLKSQADGYFSLNGISFTTASSGSSSPARAATPTNVTLYKTLATSSLEMRWTSENASRCDFVKWDVELYKNGDLAPMFTYGMLYTRDSTSAVGFGLDGLAVDAKFTARVREVCRAEVDNSEWSDKSEAMSPFRQPAVVYVDPLATRQMEDSIKLSWTVTPNGCEMLGQELTLVSPGSRDTFVPSGCSRQEIGNATECTAIGLAASTNYKQATVHTFCADEGANSIMRSTDDWANIFQTCVVMSIAMPLACLELCVLANGVAQFDAGPIATAFIPESQFVRGPCDRMLYPVEGAMQEDPSIPQVNYHDYYSDARYAYVRVYPVSDTGTSTGTPTVVPNATTDVTTQDPEGYNGASVLNIPAALQFVLGVLVLVAAN